MDLEKYKQVISDAIKGEIEAKHFYEKVAKRIKDAYLKELFEQFSREEGKHETILTRVLNEEKMDTSFFDYEKDFKVSETIAMPVVNEEMDLKSAVGIAMKNEEIAMKQYMALAENCDDEQLKKVFLDLAAMERNHKFKMEQKFVDVAYPEVW
ncbi:ferritin family protein [Desulfobacula toluolica]|uniref:Rbr6: putative rubrerythrin n=1 Tax=Desulfobacula toluolica (strain DSM 7467 / Tol2) TaxID=651182 RepID=K0NJA7_DESTT|nr:ferritin family protein [Desulfobacula toluolica]CCK79963.1 Rbr6: putative rubrerythrin [Desulfobacula toluolica Tol2]